MDSGNGHGTLPAREVSGTALETIGGVVIGGDYQGLGIARSLGRHGVPVCVVDDEASVARASRFVQTVVRVRDLRNEASLLSALARTRDRLPSARWVLYPTRDETVAALAANREALLSDFRVPVPGMDSISRAWDKRETYRLAAQLSIPTPQTWFPATEADLAGIGGDGPFVIKPAIKEHFIYATRVKAWRADSRAELAAVFRRAAQIVGRGEVIIQELIPGGGAEQYAYCAFFRRGQAVASMTVRRRRQHPSDFGRASTYVETVSVGELAEPSIQFLRAIDYYGLIELEYKRDPRDGRYKLLDVNARTWGYHTLGHCAGVDFPYLLFRDQVGASVEEAHARPGVRWIRVATDLPNAVRDIRAGTLRPGEYLRSLRGVDTEAVFSFRDPLPTCYEIMLLPYLAVKRGLLPAEMRGIECLKLRIPLASSTTSACRTPCDRERPWPVTRALPFIRSARRGCPATCHLHCTGWAPTPARRPCRPTASSADTGCVTSPSSAMSRSARRFPACLAGLVTDGIRPSRSSTSRAGRGLPSGGTAAAMSSCPSIQPRRCSSSGRRDTVRLGTRPWR